MIDRRRPAGRGRLPSPRPTAGWCCRRFRPPLAIVERLAQAVQEVSREPGMKERFLGAGARFVVGSPQETAAMAARERVKWQEVFRLSGAKLE